MIPRALWLITALFGAMLLFYSLLFPTYRGPDEPQHVDLILYVQETYRYPEFDERSISRGIVESLSVVRFGRRSVDLDPGEAPSREERPELRGVDGGTGAPNQVPQHPPLYYFVLGAGNDAVDLITPGEALDRPFDRTVWLLRLLNLLLLLPLPLIAFLLVRRLGASREAGIVAAILPLAIPQLTHIGSVVNNDNLLTLLVALLALPLIAVAQGDLSGRTTVGVGVLGGLALFTKGFALFVPVWIVIAYAIAGVRTSRWGRVAALSGLAIALTLAAGGWWWLRNLAVHGELQPGIGSLPPAAPGFTPDPLWWIGRFTVWMFERYWGWFGWFDVQIPVWAVVLGSVILLGGAVAAFVSPGRVRRADLFLLVFATLGIGALTLKAYRGYAASGLTPAIQGRYLFPGVVGLAAASGIGLARLFAARKRLLPPLALAAAAVIQVAGVLAALHFYWTPPGDGAPVSELRSMVAWSPWPTWVPVGIAALVVVAGVWVALELARGRVGARSE